MEQQLGPLHPASYIVIHDIRSDAWAIRARHKRIATSAHKIFESEIEMDSRFAKSFAEEWIAAWNSHDLSRVLVHYTDDFEMASPRIVQIMGEPSGVLKGKENVAAYWAKALTLVPQLHFELLDVFVGANSLVVRYRNERGIEAAETLFFNAEGKVNKAAAHYSE